MEPAAEAAAGAGLCSTLTYSTDGVEQSAEVSAAEAVALAAVGGITGSTLIFSENAEFPFEAWTVWSECCQCFGGASADVNVAQAAAYA